MDTIICTICLEEKPLNSFNKAKSKKNGLSSFCKQCAVKRTIEWREAKKIQDPESLKEYDRTRKCLRHGITRDEYLVLLEKQNFVCAACSREPKPGTELSIDHDHKCCPGVYSCGSCIRGLLCSPCNQALGLVQEDEMILVSLIKYLQGL